MVFPPNLICRFFFVTYHYCYLCPLPSFVIVIVIVTRLLTYSSLSLHQQGQLLLLPFLALSISPLTLWLPSVFGNQSSMATPMVRSSSVPSLPPPSPKSPPDYPDLYGKRREMARVQMLEREISFLQEELKSVEGLQPASRCCKEIADFVLAKSDPMLPSNKKNRRSCRFWKWLCGMPCFNFSWICCCCDGLSVHLKLPRCCCDCKPCSCSCSCLPSINCPLPKWSCCCSCPKSHCCKERCGFGNCCSLPSCCNFRCPTPSCSSCCSCKCSCTCSCPSCPKVRPCCCCTKSCWNPCCLCC